MISILRDMMVIVPVFPHGQPRNMAADTAIPAGTTAATRLQRRVATDVTNAPPSAVVVFHGRADFKAISQHI
jgi:hypothetical protein